MTDQIRRRPIATLAEPTRPQYIEMERWVAISDDRVCSRCRALDGKIFPIGEGPRPRLHPFCRCRRVRVMVHINDPAAQGRRP